MNTLVECWKQRMVNKIIDQRHLQQVTSWNISKFAHNKLRLTCRRKMSSSATAFNTTITDMAISNTCAGISRGGSDPTTSPRSTALLRNKSGRSGAPCNRIPYNTLTTPISSVWYNVGSNWVGSVSQVLTSDGKVGIAVFSLEAVDTLLLTLACRVLPSAFSIAVRFLKQKERSLLNDTTIVCMR